MRNSPPLLEIWVGTPSGATKKYNIILNPRLRPETGNLRHLLATTLLIGESAPSFLPQEGQLHGLSPSPPPASEDPQASPVFRDVPFAALKPLTFHDLRPVIFWNKFPRKRLKIILTTWTFALPEGASSSALHPVSSPSFRATSQKWENESFSLTKGKQHYINFSVTIT